MGNGAFANAGNLTIEKMTSKSIRESGLLKINKSTEGMSIETKLRKLKTEKTPIKAVSPRFYTTDEEGIPEEFNIRHQKFEMLQRQIDNAISASRAAKEISQDAGGVEVNKQEEKE